MVVILATAAGLRFYTLDRGIWYDEMLMHISHMHLSPLQILTTFKDANNHILYTFLARLSIDALGDTVTAIRIPAALFGIASIAAIYGFARRVMSWPEALAAAFLLALSYHHLWFSQNARGYTALLFFSLLSSSFLIDAMRTGSTKRWVAYAVAGALGAFTHLTIGFLFIGHFLFFLYRAATRRGDGTFPLWSGIFQGFGILTLLTLVLHAIVLPDILGGALLGSGLQGDSEWTNPLWALRELLGSLRLGFSGAGVLAAGGLVVLVGMARFARSDGAPVAFFVIPVGLAVLLMTSIGYTLFPRFFFFAMGFAIVIVIHGATAFGALA
ncbi:MAG: glycosyltransferase family 39 protein, partial [Paracoccaceae bacterium]|nr:glycosyltransferase family 39 protein [Paracoccaceae bacterium]